MCLALVCVNVFIVWELADALLAANYLRVARLLFDRGVSLTGVSFYLFFAHTPCAVHIERFYAKYCKIAI